MTKPKIKNLFHYSACFALVITFMLTGCSMKSSKNTALKGIKSIKEVKQIVFKSNRIFLNLVNSKNDTLRFFVDTGGGNIIRPRAVRALNLKIDTVTNHGKLLEQVNLNKVLAEKDIPTKKGPIYIYRKKSPGELNQAGILGTTWFAANDVWDFEYKTEKLSVVDSINWNQMNPSKIVKVGFKEDSTGNRLLNFPRISVVVEGDTIQVLFDSGATVFLSKKAKPYFNNKKAVGTSFIVASIFEKWHTNHPEWEFIKDGGEYMKAGADMIKVPTVIIAGQKVGPVWFTKRPDKNFTKFMSQYMDRQVQGAIGGSAFQYFDTIILDYQKGLAYFQKK